MSEIPTREEFETDKAKRLLVPANYGMEAEVDNVIDHAVRTKQFYNFTWMGLPIIQFPEDLAALQEIIWATKPNIIIETGLAWGGSAAFYGSNLAAIPCERMRSVISVEKGVISGVHGELIERLLPLRVRSIVLEGDSTKVETSELVKTFLDPEDRVMVCLDSNHTADHVLAELELWAPIVTSGCYLVVFDTFVEDRDPRLYRTKPFRSGDSPMTAVKKFLEIHDEFEVDPISDKLLLTQNPSGYLRRK